MRGDVAVSSRLNPGGLPDGCFVFHSLGRELDVLLSDNKRHCLICDASDPPHSNFLMLCPQNTWDVCLHVIPLLGKRQKKWRAKVEGREQEARAGPEPTAIA